MKTRLTALLMIHVLFAASANAEPCVGPAYDRPFPGAVDVTMHYADVPAAQFPGIWQDGMIEGHFYQIFANRLAVLKADRTAPVWSINLNCQQRPCTITAAGNPPATALSTSSRLKQCLEPPESKIAVSPDAHSVPAANAPSMPAPAEAAPQPSAPEIAATAVPAPVALKPANPAPDKPAPRVAATGLGNPAPEQELPPKADAVENPATFAETTAENVPLAGYSGDIRLEPIASDATNPSPGGQPIALTGNAGTEITCPRPHSETIPLVVASCRSAVIPGSDPVATLQQLLVMAGADPGDVDGLYGGKTEGAVLEVLGYRGRNLDVSEAIDAIDAFLCGQEP